MNSYVIKKVPCADIELSSTVWDSANQQLIENFPWANVGEVNPEVTFAILYDDNGIGIKYICRENNIVANTTFHNDVDIYQDSCVEYFLNLSPDTTDKYLNFELSVTGFMHLGFGANRYDRIIQEIDFSVFHIDTKLTDGGWEAKFYIPFSVAKNYYATISPEFLGNIQKCVEATEQPHFGCWNRITTETPDFHVSEDFGKFILE